MSRPSSLSGGEPKKWSRKNGTLQREARRIAERPRCAAPPRRCRRRRARRPAAAPPRPGGTSRRPVRSRHSTGSARRARCRSRSRRRSAPGRTRTSSPGCAPIRAGPKPDPAGPGNRCLNEVSVANRLSEGVPYQPHFPIDVSLAAKLCSSPRLPLMRINRSPSRCARSMPGTDAPGGVADGLEEQTAQHATHAFGASARRTSRQGS